MEMDLAQVDATTTGVVGSGVGGDNGREGLGGEDSYIKNLTRRKWLFQDSTLAILPLSFACCFVGGCSGSGRNGLDGSYRDGTDQAREEKNGQGPA